MYKPGRLNRRQFMGSLAVAGAGFPSIVPSSVLGSDRGTAPGDRIGLGFIGMGKQGAFLLRSFMREADAQVLAVCDVDSIKREHARKLAEEFYADRAGSGQHRGITAFHDFRELLQRPGIDAVVIATPDHWHAIPAIEAAKAGKDIYCEKPLANSIGESRGMAEAARRYGRVFQTGSMQRSDERFRFACELVRNGYIGRIKKVTVNVGGPPTEAHALPAEPLPDHLDWDFWVGPAPWRPYTPVLAPPMEETGWARWRYYWDFGGGGMTDWGAHHFDIAQWGLGMDAGGPVEILPPDDKEVRVLTYRYSNGVVMTREGGVNGILFSGSEGEVEVNRGYLKTRPEKLASGRLRPDDTHLYRSGNHLTDWLKCIRTRSKPICDVEIGCRSVTVCHLGNIAYILERPLRWDPATERFQDDEAANRLIGRPYRSPWRLA
jgi:predicted dehydrogenase